MIDNMKRIYKTVPLTISITCLVLSACGAEKPINSSSASVNSSVASSSSSNSSVATVDLNSATFVPDPSWNCGVAEGLPPPSSGELVFSATLQLGGTHEFGETQYGERRLLDVTGASFSGPRIQGEFLTGGLELELMLANGAMELEQIDILRTNNGTSIYMRTCGFAPAGATESRFIPDFEAPNSSSYAWLNNGKYAGIRRVNEARGTVELEVYEVSNVAVTQSKIQLKDPVNVPNQPWECLKLSGSRGNSVLTENVTLGGSINIGQSKYGGRNIIPITGGSFSGRLSGSVLPGGADYQLSGGGGGTVLDARYTLKTNDGEYVLIRNCGPFGGLIPQFETRKNGPYAFLNQNKFLSSDPGLGGGGNAVSITFYEIR